MQERSRNKEEERLSREKQITGSHCGAGVMSMLVSAKGQVLDQEEFVESCGATKTIGERGLEVSEMAVGLKKILPKYRIWKKTEAKLSDIQKLLDYGYLVGVDWQGIFDHDEYDEIKGWAPIESLKNFKKKLTREPEPEGDQGHYCVVLEINREKGYIRFADPYGHYAGRDRFIATWEFRERWWDDTVVKVGGKSEYMYVERLLFVIADKKDERLIGLGLEKV